MTRKGFTLLEIMLITSIAAIFGLTVFILFNEFMVNYQAQKIQEKMDLKSVKMWNIDYIEELNN